MAINYAPILEDVLPAFINLGAITIPYADSPGYKSQIGQEFSYKIYSDNNALLKEDTVELSDNGLVLDLFSLSNKIKPRWFYKIQIAYKNNDEIGPYSNTAVIKYAVNPKVSIKYDLIQNCCFLNYDNTDDLAEKLVSYYFLIKDSITDIELETSEVLYYNASLQNKYSLKNSIPKNTIAITILAYYTTTNKLNGIANNGFGIVPGLTSETEIPLTNAEDETRTEPSGITVEYLTADVTVLEDDGVNELVIRDSQEPAVVNGLFLLLRSGDNGIHWNNIFKFNFPIGANPIVFYDNSIETGVTYIYAFVLINKYGVLSERIVVSGEYTNNFDCIVLSDGEKSLSVKFNPLISSFKSTVQESKTDTIGGKFPVFFRNGNLKYKEFPILGLISYLMDENNLFMDTDLFAALLKKRELTISAAADIPPCSTDLTCENFKTEREFKLAVLDWLNNGKPKLFRSIAEGNYIVLLMDISLSPNKTLGRMIGEFSSKAYECAEYTYENLLKYNLIQGNKLSKLDDSEIIELKSKIISLEAENSELKDYFTPSEGGGGVLAAPNNNVFSSIIINDLFPLEGAVIVLTYADGEPKTFELNDDSEFIEPINEINVKTITFSYNRKGNFGNVGVKIKRLYDIPFERVIEASAEKQVVNIIYNEETMPEDSVKTKANAVLTNSVAIAFVKFYLAEAGEEKRVIIKYKPDGESVELTITDTPTYIRLDTETNPPGEEILKPSIISIEELEPGINIMIHSYGLKKMIVEESAAAELVIV